MDSELVQQSKRVSRFGVITKPGVNGKNLWVQQMSYLGKTADCLMVFPYGMHANLSANNTVLSLFWSIQGNSEMRAGIGWTPGLRPDLEEDEVAYYHPKTNSIITLKNNGDIEIDTVKDGSSNNININTNDLTISVAGNANITCGGDADIKATNVNIDASVTNLGVGGNPIARSGDPVEVIVSGGSSAGTHTGTITGGGGNTSI